MEAGHHGADGSVQPSLLRGIVMEKPVPRAFDLGMIDFVSTSDWRFYDVPSWSS